MAISTIMMAAARFPEAQAVVHAQLDAVVGRDAREFQGCHFLVIGQRSGQRRRLRSGRRSPNFRLLF